MPLRYLAAALVAAITALPPGPGGAATQTLADVLAAAQAEQHASAGLFGSTEFPAPEAPRQWSAALARHATRIVDFAACGGQGRCGGGLARWDALMAEARSLSGIELLRTVNGRINEFPYRPDFEAYGRREHWASPAEFLEQSGDCEDYAIAKFLALRQIGVADNRMRVVIVFDRIRKTAHAVLAVSTGTDTVILDSLSDLVTSHRRYGHYEPRNSMNEATAWIHIPRAPLPSLAESR